MPEVGYVLTLSAFVDQDLQEQVQLTCNAPLDSTAPDLAARLATMREAAWSERIAANDRIMRRGEAIKAARKARIDSAKEAGDPIDTDAVEEEDARINAALVKVRAEHDADVAVS